MSRLAIQVVDLGFGDSGKGTLVDYLVRRHASELVVRFNGGPQAGHNVVLPDGRHHTFAQFGSGTFVPGVRTLLSRFMLIEPYALLNEAAHLASLGLHDALSRLYIDDRCLLIAPPQQVANRMRERHRGATAHGTCGLGVGECVEDALIRPDLVLRAGDLRDPLRVRQKLTAILEYKRASIADLRDTAAAEERRMLDDPSWIDVAVEACNELASAARIVSADEATALVRGSACSVFEGAQGVLLDEHHGFHPHTTWSTTTFANSDTLLDEAGSDGRRRRIGVLRTYMTRHGQGPFVTERGSLDTFDLSEPHNLDYGWQGKFRRGILDIVMLRYAVAACDGVDTLAVTHLDRLPVLPPYVCEAYDVDDTVLTELLAASGNGAPSSEATTKVIRRAVPIFRPWPTSADDAFIAQLERAVDVQVGAKSHGRTYVEKS